MVSAGAEDRAFAAALRAFALAQVTFNPALRGFALAQITFNPVLPSFAPAQVTFNPALRAFAPEDRAFVLEDRSSAPAQVASVLVDGGFRAPRRCPVGHARCPADHLIRWSRTVGVARVRRGTIGAASPPGLAASANCSIARRSFVLDTGSLGRGLQLVVPTPGTGLREHTRRPSQHIRQVQGPKSEP